MNIHQSNNSISCPASPEIMIPQAHQFWGEDFIIVVLAICTRFYIVSTKISGLEDWDEKYKILY